MGSLGTRRGRGVIIVGSAFFSKVISRGFYVPPGGWDEEEEEEEATGGAETPEAAAQGGAAGFFRFPERHLSRDLTGKAPAAPPEGGV